MNDRENVISHLQIMHIWASFALENDLDFFSMKHLKSIAEWTDEALALLKDQPEIVRCKDCGETASVFLRRFAEERQRLEYENRGDTANMEAKKKIHYVVTQYGNDWDYNFCTGIFDDSMSAYGNVFESILDSMGDGDDKEVRIRCECDHNSGSFFDVICIKPENENHSELEEGYRVYFLEEKGENSDADNHE